MKYFIYTLILTLGFGLPFYLKKKSKKNKLRKKIFEEGEDYRVSAKNIVNSLSKSKALYRELITSIHPDKFVELEKKDEATKLASRITKSKKNYNELIGLKAEVKKFLNG